MTYPRLTTKLVALAAVLIIAGSFGTLTEQAKTGQEQQKERVIKRTKFSNEPVKILEMNVAGKSIKDEGAVKYHDKIAEISDISFNAGDDWLNGMQFVVQNISPKPVVAIKIDCLVKHSTLEIPINVSTAKSFRENPLLPGASITLTVDSRVYDMTLSKMKTKDNSAVIDSVEMQVGRVYFDEDTYWSLGLMFRRDPNDRNRWNPSTDSAR